MKLVCKLSILIVVGLFFAPVSYAEDHLSSAGLGGRTKSTVPEGAGIFSPNACTPVRTSVVPPPPLATNLPPSPNPAEVRREKPFVDNGCLIGGCNGEICERVGEGGAASLCAVPKDYACYSRQYTRCKRNGDKCEWDTSFGFQECRDRFNQK